MRFFLINLDRDTDRLQYMTAELAKRGIKAERVPACLGTAMREDLKPFFLSQTGEIASAMNKGEVGCYASHLTIMQKIVDENITEPVFVLEDDLEFHDGFLEFCNNLQALPEDWDIVRLSNSTKAAIQQIGPLGPSTMIVKYWRVPNNTGCFVINRNGAEKFLAHRGLRKRPVDEDLRRPWEHGLKTYGILPPPVTSNIFDSTLAQIGGDRSLPARKRFRDAKSSLWQELCYRLNEFGLFGSLSAIFQTVLFKNKIKKRWSAQNSNER